MLNNFHSMNYNGHKKVSEIVFQSRFPRWKQDEMNSQKGVSSQYQRFSDRKGFLSFKERVESSYNNVGNSVKKESLTESDSDLRNKVITWLENVVSVLNDRADETNNSEKKDSFQALALTIKSSIPNEMMDVDDIGRTLSLLKQRISIREEDSDHMKAIKNHILTELTKFL